jgi:glyoxylase-like metal-dependent hydrolase (beta-lactamase superfamily II)
VWCHFPKPLDDGVWALGQPSLRNYGAMAYFVEAPEGGVRIDCPRPSEALFEWLEAHGGVRWIFLIHQDHVQHQAEFAARFPTSRRVLGKSDVNRWQTPFTDVTTDVEHQLPARPWACAAR